MTATLASTGHRWQVRLAGIVFLVALVLQATFRSDLFLVGVTAFVAACAMGRLSLSWVARLPGGLTIRRLLRSAIFLTPALYVPFPTMRLTATLALLALLGAIIPIAL